MPARKGRSQILGLLDFPPDSQCHPALLTIMTLPTCRVRTVSVVAPTTGFNQSNVMTPLAYRFPLVKPVYHASSAQLGTSHRQWKTESAIVCHVMTVLFQPTPKTTVDHARLEHMPLRKSIIRSGPTFPSCLKQTAYIQPDRPSVTYTLGGIMDMID
jgi:hypothetical protein